MTVLAVSYGNGGDSSESLAYEIITDLKDSYGVAIYDSHSDNLEFVSFESAVGGAD